MTTTLRPAEPLRRATGGGLSRRFQVCVNSRPVGELHLTTALSPAPDVAQITELGIDEPDRRRGRGTVAALAAEEVARSWGCTRIEASLPTGATAARALAAALGYVERNRNMEKPLDEPPRALPRGSAARPMTAEEFGPWLVAEKDNYARSWIDRGVPETEARAKAERDVTAFLPDGPATRNMLLSVLEHEGAQVGTLWLWLRQDDAYVLNVEVAEDHRGKGHGRTLMLLAETQAAAEGRTRLGLNVFAGNTPAERLYESLGHRPVTHHLYKSLL